MIPEAWQNDALMSASKKAYYRWNAYSMEPWDGPGLSPLSLSLCVCLSVCLFISGRIVRHVSFMRICDCCVFRILPYFSHISAKCAYRLFFPHELAFSTAVLIFLVFLLTISIRFRHLDHLIANRMAPSMCLDPCGTRCGIWFQAILYHISASIWYLVFMRSAYFFLKCGIKLTCLHSTV